MTPEQMEDAIGFPNVAELVRLRRAWEREREARREAVRIFRELAAESRLTRDLAVDISAFLVEWDDGPEE